MTFLIFTILFFIKKDKIMVSIPIEKESVEFIRFSSVDSQISNDWEFFDIESPIEIQIVEYFSPKVRCSRSISNGLAIAIFNSDTIRIIDQCPSLSEKYIHGEKLFLYPTRNFNSNMINYGLPYIDGKLNPLIFSHPTIKKTTFGNLYK